MEKNRETHTKAENISKVLHFEHTRERLSRIGGI
jgi:hypothetical protein